jgi:uncharacterized cupin superfamily protein
MICTRALVALAIVCVTAVPVAQADTIKPIKDSKPDIGGAIFQRKDASSSQVNGNKTTDVVTFTSSDTAFQTGVYKSGPDHETVGGPQGYPYNEFMYFISGSVKLTSSDGSVMKIHAGEAVTLPSGWTGKFDTEGYSKLYVDYHPVATKK